MVYVDTSVLVAYYCQESISDQVELILLQTESPAISQLTEVELVSAIARKIREQSLTLSDGNKILSLFQSQLEQRSFVLLPVHTGHYSKAKIWISQFITPLKTLDSLHLAIADEQKIPILTADIQLAKSAEMLGIEVKLVS